MVVALLLVSGSCTRRNNNDVVERVFGGQEVFNRFVAAQAVTAERLHYRREDESQSLTRLKTYKYEAAVTIGAPHAVELRRLLKEHSSYGWETDKECSPRYGVLLNFQGEPRPVRVALCFECNTLAVFDDEEHVYKEIHAKQISSEHDFDPIRPQLVAIAKAIFPNDAEIQALK